MFDVMGTTSDIREAQTLRSDIPPYCSEYIRNRGIIVRLYSCVLLYSNRLCISYSLFSRFEQFFSSYVLFRCQFPAFNFSFFDFPLSCVQFFALGQIPEGFTAK